MKKYFYLLLSSLLVATTALAHEPVNIDIAKQNLKQYYNSGSYQNDIANVMQRALRYLEMRVKQGNFQGKKPAIVLDIDETSLSNYRDIATRNFGGTLEEIRQDEDKGTDAIIEPTLKLFRFAKANHVAIFFVTGRFEEERIATDANLEKAGFVNHDGLILRSGNNRNVSATVYKKAIRKELSSKGYDIVLNIGDQLSDLRGGYADKAFKLPNPFYYIP